MKGCKVWLASLTAGLVVLVFYYHQTQLDSLTSSSLHKVLMSMTGISEHSQNQSLPEEVVSGVRLFVLFVGYPRSGHSIIASLLDAHPNVVLAHELNIFEWVEANPNFTKTQLFNQLIKNTYNTVYKHGARSRNNKGYNLTVDNSWQGKYRERIDVIGDKCGGKTSRLYTNHYGMFQRLYTKLRQVISIPIRFIHCVRNPFDIISTILLYKARKQDLIVKTRNDFHNKSLLHLDKPIFASMIKRQMNFAESVLNLSQSLTTEPSQTQMLEVHNHELVSHPEQTILKLCKFLEISCSSDYVKSCASKVFPELSRTRLTVDWPEEVKKIVQNHIQKYPFFRRYTYDGVI